MNNDFNALKFGVYPFERRFFLNIKILEYIHPYNVWTTLFFLENYNFVVYAYDHTICWDEAT